MRNLLLLVAAAACFATQPSGNPSASLTIEIYSDYQCPNCRVLHVEAVKPLIAEYVYTGRVHLIEHQFPLPMHPYAKQAALFAEAAGRIKKYEPVSDAIFQDQPNWSKNGNVEAAVKKALTPAEFEKVKKLVSDPAVIAAVTADVAAGQKAGVNQTPYMIFTHAGKKTPISGAISWPILKRFIDDRLGGK